MTEKPDGEYQRGFLEGWKAGYEDGKSVGYVDAKVRSRLALEAVCEQIGAPRELRQKLMRAADNVVGKVE